MGKGAEMTIENKEMGISFEVDNQQDFDKWYAIRKEQIRADAIDDALNLDRYKFGVTMLTAEEYIKVSDLKQLKEQK